MSIYIAVSVSSGAVYRVEFATTGRFPRAPRQSGWVPNQALGTWSREPTDANIEAEVRDLERYWQTTAEPVSVVSWRRLTEAEAPLFEANRTYRNALVMQGDKIVHDMPRARECHRKHLRRLRAHALPELDANWMRATGQGKAKEAADIEAQRQKWRDVPADKRIDAAKNINELAAILPPA